MRTPRALNGRDHRGTFATVVTAVVTVAGLGCVGSAVVHYQQGPPQPALSTIEPTDSPASHPSEPERTPTPTAAGPETVGPVLRASVPTRLSIPTIDVRSPVQRLGQTADGELEVPKPGPHYDEAGWYRYSPTPGSLGPAVIVGHLDSAHGRSIFWRLGDLQPHDKVHITRADGSVAVFAVNAVRRFRKDRFPTRLVYGDTNHAALRLITCGGPIERSTGHHRDNIIVLASLVKANTARKAGG